MQRIYMVRSMGIEVLNGPRSRIDLIYSWQSCFLRHSTLDTYSHNAVSLLYNVHWYVRISFDHTRFGITTKKKAKHKAQRFRTFFDWKFFFFNFTNCDRVRVHAHKRREKANGRVQYKTFNWSKWAVCASDSRVSAQYNLIDTIRVQLLCFFFIISYRSRNECEVGRVKKKRKIKYISCRQNEAMHKLSSSVSFSFFRFLDVRRPSSASFLWSNYNIVRYLPYSLRTRVYSIVGCGVCRQHYNRTITTSCSST